MYLNIEYVWQTYFFNVLGVRGAEIPGEGVRGAQTPGLTEFTISKNNKRY